MSNSQPKWVTILGWAVFGIGLLELLLWLFMRATDVIQTALLMVPFFGNLDSPNRLGFVILQLVTALMLLAGGWVLARGWRRGPLLAAAATWGVTLLWGAAWFPTQGLKNEVNFLMSIGRNRGMIPQEATLWDLIPAGVIPALVICLLVWVVLLAASSVSALRFGGARAADP